MCLGCFSRFRPRYKRLIDDIFPQNPEDGLVKANMGKLTFYALSTPEKLDRIGEYLYQKASRDIHRRRTSYVVIAMEAMDKLLVACHSQMLNLFVESFLKIVQKLLESPEPDLQILATNSFVRFANIEEDTPSYHRRYDFFVSKFSGMCHSNYLDVDKRNKLRLAGIRGIQGVIRKTVSDELVENIWEPTHMDKIVPSLLFNMQESVYFKKPELDQDEEEETEKMMNHKEDVPDALAETCLRELMSRASFGHVKNVIRPVLLHLDAHCLWDPNIFATHCFRLLMYSIQSQYSYVIVECLMNHLNEHDKSPSIIRAKIADVVSKIISIAASESIGPTVLEIVNSILRHLRESVLRTTVSNFENHDEKSYQEALIIALGEFAANLPDYQKIEIMMFIISKVPSSRHRDSKKENVLVQVMYMKGLLMVSSKYNSIQMNSTFPSSFLEPLMKILLSPEPEIRILVNKVLHILLDRHGNLNKILKPTVTPNALDLINEKPSRSDILFIRKHGPDIYLSICESLDLENNCIENYEAIYTTMALICIELLTDETLVDFIRTIMNIQEIAMTTTQLNDSQKYNLHALVVSLFTLVPIISNINNIKEYITKVLNAREVNQIHHLLPEFRMHYDIKNTIIPLNSEDIYFTQTDLAEYLKNTDQDLISNNSNHSLTFQHRHSWVDNANVTLKSSVSDLNLESDSEGTNTPTQFNKKYQDLTFENMKKILTQTKDKQLELEKRKQVLEKMKKCDFDEIVNNNTTAYEQTLQYKLNEVFSKLEDNNNNQNNNNGNNDQPKKKPRYETLFPELFMY